MARPEVRSVAGPAAVEPVLPGPMADPPLPSTPVPAWRRLFASGDRDAALLAGAACLGAWVAAPIPLWLAVGVVGVALLWRRPWVLVVGVALLTSSLGARATAGLVVDAGPWRGTVEVVRVAVTTTGDVHAEVRAGGHHLDLVPRPEMAARAKRWRPGDRFRVTGRISPVDPTASRNRGSHVAGRLHPATVTPGGRPRGPWRVADAVHSAVLGLARPLPPSQQALFAGFVLGDASGQSDLQRADFRASGLTHLLVASGENVAFVLLLAAPVLARLGLRSRWAAAIGLCALYVLVTGLEPSVLRAATMAVVATTGAGIGRPVRSARSLALAVTVLVVADPFLVHAVSFGLSVGASVGILVLARPLTEAMGGPRWLRAPLAVTVAAQIGVAPFLLGFPGGLPVATLPANLLAVVPAGLVMVAGVPALAVAASGLPGTGLFVRIPRLLLGWVDAVARWTASRSLGYLGTGAVAVATLGVVVALVADRRRTAGGGTDGTSGPSAAAPGWQWLRRGGFTVAVVALAVPVVAGAGPPAGGGTGGPVVVRRGSATVVVLTGAVPTEELLRSLSAARVHRVDLVVVPHGDGADRAMLAAIGHRCRIAAVSTPKRLTTVRWPQRVAHTGDRIAVGAAVLEVVATEPVLAVHVVDGTS